ncbi:MULTISPECIES: DUF4747 family protein [unclassified Shinella]|uniref:DUF4747 family protein n=1 Tax=unclassified Shinella TaxID=2643062 RepID=UPI00234F58E0|nr:MULTISPECIES: DUF4747 family protein [unclassified Shinella]MCO5152840.1 DUF4747 family protein [Shinella sp.]MDC7260832.1 DUF4747 family protein [Shinella sp. HY16]MDC7267727.1 DUF4747 family protein [Shinella sp. YZ44]
MARRIKVSVGIVNIRLHPHSQEIYSSFIHDVYRLKQPFNIHGDRYAMISMLDRSGEDSNEVSGIITTFTRIETDGAWFDAANLQEATDNQVSEINIPDNLYPNAASFYFLLDTKEHKIYVQQYSKGKQITSNSVLKYFRKAADNLEMLAKYNSAKISIVQSTEGLEALFNLKKINEIKITILKPNSDIFADDFEAKVEAHLAETHAQKLVLTYDAEPGQSIVAGKDIRAVSTAALENGSVQVKGRDETGAVTRSTEEFPKILQDTYDPDEISEKEAFRRIVASQG